MILPQMEAGTPAVDVLGMFFFHDNTFVLRKGDPVGERLSRLAQKKGMLLMMCDACAMERNLAEGELRWCDADGNGRTQPGDCQPKNVVAGAGRLLPGSVQGAVRQSARSGDYAIAYALTVARIVLLYGIAAGALVAVLDLAQ